jgi:hypothetical protein
MEIKFFFRKINPKALSLFTERFLRKEMEAHGIEEVAVSELLSILRGQPMVYIPKEKKIVIDPTYPVDEMIKRLNRENGCSDLNLSADESWGYIFFHECCHAMDTTKSEYQCNSYARERIILWRKGL